jgi:hypothetical protein
MCGHGKNEAKAKSKRKNTTKLKKDENAETISRYKTDND